MPKQKKKNKKFKEIKARKNLNVWKQIPSRKNKKNLIMKRNKSRLEKSKLWFNKWELWDLFIQNWANDSKSNILKPKLRDAKSKSFFYIIEHLDFNLKSHMNTWTWILSFITFELLYWTSWVILLCKCVCEVCAWVCVAVCMELETNWCSAAAWSSSCRQVGQ